MRRHARLSVPSQVAAPGQDHLTLGQAYHVLAMERYWMGHPTQGVEYCQHAIAALERLGEDERLGMAYFVLGLNALSLGCFDQALEAAARVEAIGAATADRRLQTFAAWTTGWVQATRGEWEAGIASCQRALECSSDPLNTAFAMGWLGYAYLEQGDLARAMPALQQAVQSLRQFGYRRLEGLYTTLVGEIHLRRGDLDTARTLALQGLSIASETPYRIGSAWAQRTLGRIAQAAGALAEAEVHLTEALTTFTVMQAHFEVGRTHLSLAELAQHRGHRDVIMLHLTEAYSLFTAWHAPVYAQHTAQRAQALGLTCAEPDLAGYSQPGGLNPSICHGSRMRHRFSQPIRCTRQEPSRQRLLPGHALLPGRRYRDPGHRARRHRGIIARWVRAVVPHRCRRGSRDHANVGCGSNPYRGYVVEYPPIKTGIDAIDVPIPVVWGCNAGGGVAHNAGGHSRHHGTRRAWDARRHRMCFPQVAPGQARAL